MKAFIGADPGVSGALALYAPVVPEPYLEVLDTPTVVLKEKRYVDMYSLADILARWRDETAGYGWEVEGFVERVHSSPQMGVTSAFNFGFSAGALQQAFASANIPVTLVVPAVWKAIYGLRGGRENKGMSRAKATEFFPKHAARWARAKDDGRAEAALLAHYGSTMR